jgi:hypothetical protein
MTAISLVAVCKFIVESVEGDKLTPELIEVILDDLEVGDYSIHSALTNCLEPVGY